MVKVLRRVELGQAGGDVAAADVEAQVWVVSAQLGGAAQGGCADEGVGRQLGEKVVCGCGRLR